MARSAILHDATMFPEPHKFIPERFLRQEGKEPPLRPETVAFGFGRRYGTRVSRVFQPAYASSICPGRYLALNSAWIAMTSILRTYTIGKALDADGNYIDPLVEYTPGTVSCVECRISESHH